MAEFPIVEAWERRQEITPSDQTRRRPAPMAVFKLLPQTNCQACGEPYLVN